MTLLWLQKPMRLPLNFLTKLFVIAIEQENSQVDEPDEVQVE